MRRRLSKLTVATMAAAGTALLVSACTAPVNGAPPDADNLTSATVVPQASSLPPVPQAPPAEPTVPVEALQTRVSQAIAGAAESGADITTAVLDRTTGEMVSQGANTPFPIASVVKLFIADDLLYRESKGETELSEADLESLGIMLRSSDDSAAQMFWDRSGGNAVIARVVARYGLTGTTAPYNGHWDVTQSTANDLVRYYAKLLDGSGGLPPAQAQVIVGNLARFTPTGTDGYPQRFGIPDGLYDETVAVKQGWFCCWNGANQLHVSTGIIGPDRRYLMAISSLDPVSAEAARERLTAVVTRMFPGGKVSF